MGIKAGNLPTSTIDNTDYLLITEGEAPKRVAYSDVKADMVGSETLTTTSQTVKGAINEIDLDIGDKTTLTTTNKTSLVNAINENVTSLSDLTQKGVVYKIMPASFDITKLSTWTENGIYLTELSGVTDLPAGWTQGRHVVIVFNPGNAIYGAQLIFPYQGAGGVFKKMAFRNTIIDGSVWKEVANVDDTGWVNLTLLNGVTNNTGTAQYRKIGKLVNVRGCVTNISSANVIIATLPTGFRPSAKIGFMNWKTGANPTGWSVDASGNIVADASLNATYTAGNFNWINVSFMVD